MRLLRLCLLILALRLFLSDPIMCYDFVVDSLFGEDSSAAVSAVLLPGRNLRSDSVDCVLKLSGKYVTIFWGESQAERVSMPHFFMLIEVKRVTQTNLIGHG